ncbi:hypothetical protein C8R46DRAFT_1163059 [Mycena filopes]|nr:hypothetical protein C8R46DRAFT_1163059 [Mycena filopes]
MPPRSAFQSSPPTIFDDLPPTQWAPVASRMKKRENGPPKSKNGLSPAISPIRKKLKTMPQIRRLEDEGEVSTPPRRPLGVRPLNTPGSPAVVNKPKRPSGSGTPYTKQRFSPFVDILVVDDAGTTISQERRVSGSNRCVSFATLRTTDMAHESSPHYKTPTATTSSRHRNAPRRLRRLISTRVESDESDSSDDAIAYTLTTTASQAYIHPTRTTTPIPASPSPIHRPRQLTPIRGARRMYAPPSPPSPTTPTEDDLDDLTLDISSLDISPPPAPAPPVAPAYLQPLLAECGQRASGLLEFSAFIRSFPFDPLVCGRGGSAGTGGFRKIGEASYSEVFGIGDVVLKVIPLALTETQRRLRPNAAVEPEGPFATDAKDVLKEIIVTHAMGEVCDGFVKLLRTYIVKGTYPQVLLELWDEYYERKGSEGVRPDTFALSQAYAIIVLPNGGPDLEAAGWKQACSVFWQVAKALAQAEQLVSFEHRDLHLGQILVRETSAPDVPRALQTVNQNRVKAGKEARPMMDDPVHGVRATLIDLGLSRMDAGDGSGGEMVHWTPFEDEIFMGEGDYQFDIYRYMRAHNGGNWEAFDPLTNALVCPKWLHYLAVKLLKGKGLRAPTRRKSQAPSPPSAGFTDRDCYECMIDLEEWLGRCVAAVVAETGCKTKGKGKKKKGAVSPSTQTPAAQLLGPLCAGEVVGYAVKKGWVRALA